MVIEVFTTDSPQHVSALFREINAAEPVRLVDLLQHEPEPEESTRQAEGTGAGSGAASDGSEDTKLKAAQVPSGTLDFLQEGTQSPDQSVGHGSGNEDEGGHAQLLLVLNSATEQLAARHPIMFKPSSRCKPPHLNVDVLRDELYQSGFLRRHPAAARSSEGLLRLLLRVNSALALVQPTARAAAGSALQSPSKSQAAAERKAAEHRLYLGLDKAWLYAQYADEA